MNHTPLNPITEDDIAHYLANTPEFFDRHSELLATVQLVSPHSRRAVSLQERQAEMLREKIRQLEHRIMDMIRHGNENLVLADKLLHWAGELFQAQEPPARLPAYIADSIQGRFAVPQAAIRAWDVAPEFAGHDFAQGASEDTRRLAAALDEPYCGVNSGFDAVQWLDKPQEAASLALLPLRGAAGDDATAPPIGLLVLASPDPQRFVSTMGTDFLQRIAALAGAALGRLR